MFVSLGGGGIRGLTEIFVALQFLLCFLFCTKDVNGTSTACLMLKAEKETYRKLNVFWICPRSIRLRKQNDLSSSPQGAHPPTSFIPESCVIDIQEIAEAFTICCVAWQVEFLQNESAVPDLSYD